MSGQTDFWDLNNVKRYVNSVRRTGYGSISCTQNVVEKPVLSCLCSLECGHVSIRSLETAHDICNTFTTVRFPYISGSMYVTLDPQTVDVGTTRNNDPLKSTNWEEGASPQCSCVHFCFWTTTGVLDTCRIYSLLVLVLPRHLLKLYGTSLDFPV